MPKYNIQIQNEMNMFPMKPDNSGFIAVTKKNIDYLFDKPEFVKIVDYVDKPYQQKYTSEIEIRSNMAYFKTNTMDFLLTYADKNFYYFSDRFYEKQYSELINSYFVDIPKYFEDINILPYKNNYSVINNLDSDYYQISFEINNPDIEKPVLLSASGDLTSLKTRYNKIYLTPFKSYIDGLFYDFYPSLSIKNKSKIYYVDLNRIYLTGMNILSITLKINGTTSKINRNTYIFNNQYYIDFEYGVITILQDNPLEIEIIEYEYIENYPFIDLLKIYQIYQDYEDAKIYFYIDSKKQYSLSHIVTDMYDRIIYSETRFTYMEKMNKYYIDKNKIIVLGYILKNNSEDNKYIIDNSLVNSDSPEYVKDTKNYILYNF